MRASLFRGVRSAVFATWIAVPLSAQGALQLVGPVVTGDLATGPTQLVPMVDIQVTVLGAATVGPPVVSGRTDDDGRIAYPFGFVPAQVLLGGPENPGLEVHRHVVYPPGSQSYLQVQSTANIPVAGLGSGPFDISAYPGAPLGADLTVAQCNAWFHGQRAQRALGPMVQGLVTGPVRLEFGVASSPAQYGRLQQAIFFPALADPNAAIAARSASTIAHEYGHHVIENLYLPAAPLPRMNEGLADYLATTVTGSPWIGLGAISVPRTADNSLRYLVDFIAQEHHDGQVVAGAMYHARELFTMHGRRARFDGLVTAALSARPIDEPDLLRILLLLDDDDGNPANCTPNADLLHRAFTAMHGVPWPSATGCSPTVVGSVQAVAGGWSAASTSPPDLRGSLASSPTSIGLQATFARAGVFGFFQGSVAPSQPLQLGPGLVAYLDSTQLLPALWFFTDGAGRGAFTASLPAGLPPLAFHGVVFEPTAPLGVEVSNGLLVTP
ncbi:MAG: hypothetical protein AB7O97_15065 [Planctomycetota bacterium]